MVLGTLEYQDVRPRRTSPSYRVKFPPVEIRGVYSKWKIIYVQKWFIAGNEKRGFELAHLQKACDNTQLIHGGKVKHSK